MAKRQGRKPGRDVRGGSGKRGGHGQTRAVGASGHRMTTARHRSQRGIPANRTQRSAKPLYIEGRRACAEAVEAGVPLRRALVMRAASDAGTDAALAQLVERIASRDIEIERVSRSQLDELSSHGAHQGIMLEAQPFSYAPFAELVSSAGNSKNALVVVVDHVVDEGNLGAIIRSAEVVGASGVVVARARAAGVGIGAYKTSAGAVLHIPVAQVANIATAVSELREAGFWAVAATEHAERSVWDLPFSGRIALVMGSEESGVSRLVRERCDVACRLPQRGRIESLNVAQAATALCYEWLRRCVADEDGE